MTMVISTSPANRCVSPDICTCCVTFLNRKSKLAESTTSVRRKRLRLHCHFRHCSGIVSAEKLMKKRRKRSCVHMHVSQDSITDFWKFCIKNMNDDSQNRADDIKNEDATIVDECKDKIRKNCRCNVLSKNVKSIKTETNLEDALQEDSKRVDEMPSKPCTAKVDAKEEVSIDSSCNNVINKVQNYLSNTSRQVSTQDITDSQTVNKICDDTMKYEVRTAFDEELIKMDDSNKYDCSSKESRKESHSGSSFSETLGTDNCMDLILYRELREKRIPKTIKKTVPVHLKSSKSIESKLNLKPRTIKLLKYSDVDNETRKNCLQSVFAKKNNEPSLECSQKEGIHNEFETRSTYFDACRASKANQKNFRGNCYCDSKSRDRTQSFLNPKISQQRLKTFCENSQRQTSSFSGGNAKLKRVIDSMFDRKSTLVSEKCLAKCKTSFPQNKKNTIKVKSSRSRSLKDLKYEDSTDSSSTVSSASSDSGDRIAFRSPYKSTMHDQYTHYRSSPTDLSWRKCPSCTVLFEHPTCHKREPISNVNKWRRKYQRRRGSPTSTSSTSFVSPPIFREDCVFNRNNVDQSMRVLFRKNNQNRSFRESILYEQGTKNRMMYTNDRRVTWGFKRAY